MLEVIALHAADAERAEQGGADRIEFLGSMDDDGMSPEPLEVERARRRTSIQIRPIVRLRPGFSTDGGEAVRLRGLISAYLDAGADGVVMGFLNAHSDIDVHVATELVGASDVKWTFHRAMDHCLNRDRAWRDVVGLPGVDQVLTAGSVRDVEHGLDDLIARASGDSQVAKLTMAGGGLRAEHVPWLVHAGIRAFHIGSPARPGGSYKAYVDESLVRMWRGLIDDTIRHERQRASAR